MPGGEGGCVGGAGSWNSTTKRITIIIIVYVKMAEAFEIFERDACFHKILKNAALFITCYK